MSWTVRESNTVGARFFAPVQTDTVAHPAYYTIGTRSSIHRVVQKEHMFFKWVVKTHVFTWVVKKNAYFFMGSKKNSCF
jgi:hypothetical protein